MAETAPPGVDPGRPGRTSPVLLDQYGHPLLPRRVRTTGELESERYLTYRLPASTFWHTCGGPLVAIPIFLLASIVAGGGELRWLPLGVALALSLLIWRARTIATTTTPDEVIVRGILSTRRLSWAEIQDIRIRPYSGMGLGPMEIAVLYDRAGRSTILGNLNDRDLAARRLTLRGEVNAIRVTWRRRRGNGWVPMPDVQRRITCLEQETDSPWLIGMVAALLSLLPLIVLELLVVGGAGVVIADPPWSLLFGLWLPVFLPVLTFVTVSGFALRRRAWARRDIPS